MADEKTSLTPEQLRKADFMAQLILDLAQCRRDENLSQRQLEALTGLVQPVIARLERGGVDPRLSTLYSYLLPMGKKLAIVPIDD